MSVRGCAHGFAFGYCPTCQGLNPGLTPPVVFDFTGQSPDRYAKALAVVEAATEYALAVGEWVQRDQLEPPLRTLKAAKKLSNAQHDLKAAS